MTAPSKPVLVADIGGTNARFALADVDASVPLLDDTSREFAVVDFGSLGEAARYYLDQIGVEATQGVFAAAGGAGGGDTRLTNHPVVGCGSRSDNMPGLSRLPLVTEIDAKGIAS
ncbi:glucokinase, partial [Xanthomonas euvesicatoria]|uniref:glucokinase n=1 Tax=Xanthomonas citri TaxID=346 RepID=UPI002ED77094|nr:glucokinase [Xanthomonas euvesicatoria]